MNQNSYSRSFKGQRRSGGKNFYRRGANGFTLFELLIAVLLLGMISVMIYSVLNVGIKFSDKGERALAVAARQHAIVNLLYRQIVTAYYDNVQKTVRITGEGEVLRVVNRSPLRYRNSGIVLSVYRYDPGAQVLYYTEKQDYFNADYDEEYLPDFDAMLVLASGVPPLSFEVDEESKAVSISFGEEQFEIFPRCIDLANFVSEGLPQ